MMLIDEETKRGGGGRRKYLDTLFVLKGTVHLRNRLTVSQTCSFLLRFDCKVRNPNIKMSNASVPLQSIKAFKIYVVVRLVNDYGDIVST